MLVLLGALNVHSVLRDARALAGAPAHPPDHIGAGHGHPHAPASQLDSSPCAEDSGHSARRLGRRFAVLRPLFIGIVHGLAGSAAVALLVLGAINDAPLALAYLLVFGAGTIAGMVLITTALAVPLAAAAQRFASFHRLLGVATGLASVLFGVLLVYEIGFVQGLFRSEVHWSPH
jgi:high-affinity nickel-transport protein